MDRNFQIIKLCNPTVNMSKIKQIEEPEKVNKKL